MAPGVLTLRSALEFAAAAAPCRGITLYDKRARKALRRSFPEILAGARATARRWRAAGLSEHDRVLIALPTSWEWVDAWLGALFATAIPVSARPSGGFGSGHSDIHRVGDLAERVGARFILVSEDFRAEALALGLRRLYEQALSFRELASVAPGPHLSIDNQPSATSFLQFTSGTEGFPRAVAISDTAAIHNTLALSQAILAPLDGQMIDTIVSWLPLYHDMGLVGALLNAILHGRDLILLPPQIIVSRPWKWLQEIACSRSVLSLYPAFGLSYCVERVPRDQGSVMNLSSWRAAVCGSEPIHPQVIAEFASAFSDWGFCAEAFRAGYGLAEATLAVTLDQKGKGLRTRRLLAASQTDHEAREITCVGEPVPGTEIRCVGPNGVSRQQQEIGEVLVRGDGLFTGYFNDLHATKAAFMDGWLRTGDLGFICAGELYVTGRIKELLIVRGEKFMPQQLEWVAEAVSGGISSAAAFSVERDGEGEAPVMVVESSQQDSEQLAQIGSELRSRIGAAFGLQLADLVFVPRGRIPRTSSGKIRRGEAHARYIAGALQSPGHEIGP